ncbi:MAG: sel1 repeat family protein [Geminicoccaceae bacterium]|nr:sel1 repeat family protein [Geminicoccaceae bacterium]
MLGVAEAALERRDFVAAASTYRSLAEAGIARAQLEYARMLLDGQGVRADEVEAAAWLQRAADGGEVTAMRELGRLYVDGVGVETDTGRAASLFAAAAERGDETARYELARMSLDSGHGDPALAVAAMTRAAMAGHIDAQLDLAAMHVRGRYLPKDPGEARRWYRIASTALAAEAERGDGSAKMKLAALQLAGKGVPQNTERAVAAYRELAQRGRVSAMVALARLYKRGAPGLPADRERAIFYFEQAVERGHVGATYDLAKLFYAGGGPRADRTRAARLFARALERGEPRSLTYLGEIYSDDWEGRDYAKAADFHARAALRGEGKSAFRLAEMNERGRIENADAALALALYRRAAAAGYARGAERAKRLEAELGRAEKDRAAALEQEWIARATALRL